MKYSFSLVLVIILVAILIGCAPPNPDKGDVKIFYGIAETPSHQQLEEIFKENQPFEAVAEDLNNALILPLDIIVLFTSCNEANAFFDPDNTQIRICYELIEYFEDIFTDNDSSIPRGTKVVDSTLFVFYHEMGHALIDVLKLPVTGKEEDAVDQLAALILLESGQADVALNGARFFFIEGAQANVEDLAFWDEHSLDLQRFYNLVCLIYGKDIQKYGPLITEEYLPEERASRCTEEYTQTLNSWNALLKPHFKKT